MYKKLKSKLNSQAPWKQEKNIQNTNSFLLLPNLCAQLVPYAHEPRLDGSVKIYTSIQYIPFINVVPPQVQSGFVVWKY